MSTHPSLPPIFISGLAIAVFGGALASCVKPFEVNVNTPAPIKVDLSMDVNVYQHGLVEKKEAASSAGFRAAMESRRDRMSEIQELKNNRLIGEGRSGLLSIRNLPAGDYGDYVEKTVEEENQDREALMRQEAAEKSVELAKVREEQWHHWQRKSFPGEWIEVADDDGTTFRWEQKQGAAEE